MSSILEYYILSHTKPPTEFLIGAEFEYHTLDQQFRPVSFHGAGGASELLGKFQDQKGWRVKDYLGNAPLALDHDRGHITLEPGCQFEFSSKPRQTLFQIRDDLSFFLKDLKELSATNGLRFFSLGVNPLFSPEKIPLLPKPRYRIMNQLFQETGTHGQWMMRATCSQQVCVDFASEADLMKKLYLGFYLAPFSRALFANSVFHEGQKGEMLCFRNHIWQHTDPNRSGIPLPIFSKKTSLRDYCEFSLNTPAIFQTMTDGTIKPSGGKNFHDLHPPQNWEDMEPQQAENLLLEHLSQSFIEARIKGYLELRTPDGQIPRFQFAPAAFYKGIFHNSDTLNEAFELVEEYSANEILALHHDISTKALLTPLRSYEVIDVIKELLKIAVRGLQNQSQGGVDEEEFLAPLCEIVFENGYSPADFLLRMYERDCNSNLRKLISSIEIEAPL